MAFELIAPNRRSCIDFPDELLFDVARLAAVGRPTLERLEREFYDSPRFTAAECQTLASELRALHQLMMGDPEIVQRAWDRRPEAYRKNYPRPAPATLEAKLLELHEVCEDGMETGQGLQSLSD